MAKETKPAETPAEKPKEAKRDPRSRVRGGRLRSGRLAGPVDPKAREKLGLPPLD
jgi:hypothetical protein